MVADSASGRAIGESGADRSLRVTVFAAWAEIVGAVLMDLLGSFEEEAPGQDDTSGTLTLIFYPDPEVDLTLDEIIAALTPESGEYASGVVSIETRTVSRDWVEGWRAHFHPVVIGAVRIRPPWEPEWSADGSEGFVDVVINPGLGFGTGLHPTTRGVLQLLQGERVDPGGPVGGWSLGRLRGPLVDVGTGSGILAIAAARLGWKPILAFDNDAAALISARENIVANGVQEVVQVHEIGAAEAPASWFDGATVLANMTLEPVSVLLRRLGVGAADSGAGAVAGGPPPELGRPNRLLVSGILTGAQERELRRGARESGFIPGGRVCEDEWVSLELLPVSAAGGATPAARGQTAPASTAAGADGG